MSRSTRRRFLRGLSAGLCLPALDGFGFEVARSPLRLLYVYSPNGMHMSDWTPTSEGPCFHLPPTLAPLEAFRDRMLVLSGLTHDKARSNGDGPGDHARAGAVFLTGVQPLKAEGRVHVGISADQIAARELGHATRLRSLQVGCEGGRQSGQCDSGYSCAYSNSISWAGPKTPLGKETNPRVIFDLLFGSRWQRGSTERQAARMAEERSILDWAAGEVTALKRDLSQASREKLDEYLAGVRDVERRLAHFEQGSDQPDREPFDQPVPDQWSQRTQLLAELVALAFQTDQTRIATFAFANEGSNRVYREIELSEGHHALSHHRGDEEMIAGIRKINRLHVEQFAYLLDRLAQTRDALGEDLLARTFVVYGSGISDGNRHRHEDLPVVFAGGDGAGVRTGRHLRFEPETPLNDLHVALLQRMGVELEAFGDSRSVLDLS